MGPPPSRFVLVPLCTSRTGIQGSGTQEDWDTKGQDTTEWGTTKQVLQRTRTQSGWDTMGLGHKGRGHNGTRTQWDWDTRGLGHNGAWTQGNWDKRGLGHHGTGTRGDWYTGGLGHHGAGTPRTTGLRHRGITTRVTTSLQGGYTRHLPCPPEPFSLCEVKQAERHPISAATVRRRLGVTAPTTRFPHVRPFLSGTLQGGSVGQSGSSLSPTQNDRLQVVVLSDL